MKQINYILIHIESITLPTIRYRFCLFQGKLQNVQYDKSRAYKYVVPYNSNKDFIDTLKEDRYYLIRQVTPCDADTYFWEDGQDLTDTISKVVLPPMELHYKTIGNGWEWVEDQNGEVIDTPKWIGLPSTEKKRPTGSLLDLIQD